jgi:ATP-dependent Clp protease ATP-binding subunit ClpC
LLRRGLVWVEDTARQGRGDGTGFTVRAKKVIELSLREAIRLGNNYIGTEHLLLGMIRDGGGLATKVLTEQGMSLDGLRQAAITALRRAA